LSGTFVAAFADGGTGTSSFTANFGQRAFAYTAPSGFKALCTQNLPAPLVTKSNEVFDAVKYDGNDGTQTISGLAFSPDLVWMKARSIAYYNVLYDVVRGTGTAAALYSNTTEAENANPGLQNLTAFNSNGFSLGTTTGPNIVNSNSQSYVAWCWDAGTSTVTNNSGSISSQVRANATAGFSVVTYTGNNTAGATVGHGLGVAPKMIIVKSRGVENWGVYHYTLGTTSGLLLNSTTGAIGSAWWNSTDPTSTVFSLSTSSGITNSSGVSYVAYCFAPVVGYSSFGSYTGGGTSGRFVYTGFRPKLIWVKNYNDNSYPSYTGWYMWDSVRGAYNYNQSNLNANSSNNEGIRNTGGAIGTIGVDLLSNGFCLRGSDDVDTNWGSGQYIYCAWAEAPFNYSRAR
jgi:hypothetical protein